MSDIELIPEQEDLVKQAAAQCGFTNYVIIADVGSIKGDNYLGIIHTITVKDEDSDRELHLILKSAHTSDAFRKQAPIMDAFDREAEIYSKIMPVLIEYQNEKKLSQPFTGVAKFYGSFLEEKKESILMANLKQEGYELWDRMTPMDDKHMSLVFSEYARFHAVSLALKNLSLEKYEELTKNIQKNIFEKDGEEEKFMEIIKLYFATGLDAVKESAQATSALEKMRDEAGRLFLDLKDQDKKNAVILHGDCWCNNMLFKYENGRESPSKVCFIDWQISKVGSPIYDISYFFCVNGTKDTHPNLNQYLETYHKVLSQNLREFGCNPDDIYTLEEFKAEWKRNSWFGMFMAIMMLKIMLSSSEEAISFGDIREDQDVMDAFTSYEISKSSEYNKRLVDLIVFMSENEFI